MSESRHLKLLALRPVHRQKLTISNGPGSGASAGCNRQDNVSTSHKRRLRRALSTDIAASPMKISELIAQLQSIQSSHGPDVLILRELEEPRGWIEVDKVFQGAMWPMRKENDNSDPDDNYGVEPDYEFRWASSDYEPDAPAPTHCVYLG